MVRSTDTDLRDGSHMTGPWALPVWSRVGRNLATMRQPSDTWVKPKSSGIRSPIDIEQVGLCCARLTQNSPLVLGGHL
ncbi:hypothetical protein BDQ94DRAFT_155794 [Aspergillus welwitschiae]|uniref:Uncharacterized protein n=1 Tax=Aspergillus welwitschiae TaxID=1341132 RepID=A0A3F3PHA3_9EURO|nr:hypothetical protein BDQ94DRAFT_155794 [Aspergillus welwitschiae]RDH26279.1 hypothetical protein BDQ94DRAFT_155794 [Aspergillus welwitschiae]